MRLDGQGEHSSNAEVPDIRAHVLGRVQITVGDRTILDRDWPRRSARSLFLLLLVTPRHRLPRERIIDQLWQETHADAGQNALRVALHAVRRTLEPALEAGGKSTYVQSDGDWIALRSPSGLWVDVDEFELAITNLTTERDEGRTEMIRQALTLYSGELLATEPVLEWSQGRREQLHRIWRDAVLELSTIEKQNGYLASITYLEQLLAADAADETAHRALMKAYLATGQPNEALRQYSRCVNGLRRELEVDPAGETVALAEKIRSAIASSQPPLSPPLQGRIDNLPSPPNPLIGRARELEHLEHLLLGPGVRLVTLTGPGGIGKTRLSLEVARNIAGDFAGGVCFVDLSVITEIELVIPTILRTIGVDEVPGYSALEVAVNTIGQHELLLVLDNLEQIIESATAIGTLLSSCSGLTILATSRQPLRLQAEHIVATPTLAVPPVGVQTRSDHSPGVALERYEAVTLFIERARAARPGFEVTDTNRSAIATLCSRLDGLPLAIELAAARIRHLNPDDLLAQLASRLSLLVVGARDLPARQRTLRDAIGWSYDLLGDSEQSLFRQLAVFAGGFGLDAAREVCDVPTFGGFQPAESVWTLADQSLLQHHEDPNEGKTRYRMLETIREYGLEQLAANNEIGPVRRQHALHFLKLAEHAELHLHGPNQIVWLEQLEQEHDNMRSALNWACDSGDAETAIRLSGALSEFWRMKGHLSEGRVWLHRALDISDLDPSTSRAKVLRGAGMLAQAQGDSDEGVARLNQSLDCWQALGDDRGAAETMILMADIARARGDYDYALELNERALAVFEEIEFMPGMADTLNLLGIIANDRADYDRAKSFYERSSALFDQLSDRHGAARVLNNLGNLHFWQEQYNDAVVFFECSLALWRELGNGPHTAVVLANLGEALRAEGDIDQALAITQEGLQVSRQVGDRRSEATALYILGSLTQYHEIDVRAIEPLVAGLCLYGQVGDRLGIAWCLEALAGPATAQDKPEIAAQLLGAAESLREAVGVPLKPADRAAFERHFNSTRRVLQNSESFDEYWSIGRGLTLAQVQELATQLDASCR